MNNGFVFRGYVASLIGAGVVGAVVFRFLPGWSGLVSEVGAGGAWTVLVVFHLIYTLLIGVATFIFLTILEKYKYQGSVFGAGLAAAVTVTIVNILSGEDGINFGGFLVFSLWLVWLTWVVNFVVFLLMKWVMARRAV